jgi:hypothetical protein
MRLQWAAVAFSIFVAAILAHPSVGARLMFGSWCALIIVSLMICLSIAAICSVAYDHGIRALKSGRFFDLLKLELSGPGPTCLSPSEIKHFADRFCFHQDAFLVLKPGLFVYEPRVSYNITCFYYEGQLVSSDHEILLSAKWNRVPIVKVYMVAPPLDISPKDWIVKDEIRVKLPDDVKDFACVLPNMIRRAANGSPQLSDDQLDRFIEGLFFSGRRTGLSEVSTRSVCKNTQRALAFCKFIQEQDNVDLSDMSQSMLFSLEVRVILPASAFPTDEVRPQGHVILEVDKIVCPRRAEKYGETLVALMRRHSSDITVSQSPQGPRAYARCRVSLADENVARAIIKAIAREKGKRTNIKVIESHVESPRD